MHGYNEAWVILIDDEYLDAAMSSKPTEALADAHLWHSREWARTALPFVQRLHKGRTVQLGRVVLNTEV
jgi:hypothetical protein